VKKSIKIKITNKNNIKAQSGNVLFIILVAVAILAMLTAAVSRQSGQNVKSLDGEELTQNIALLLSHADLMKSVVQRMIVDGANPGNISGVLPQDAGFATAPHGDKIYHPYGGGLQYSGIIGGTSGMLFHNDVTITGVGAGATAELVMTVIIPSQAYCLAINKKLYGAVASIPTISGGGTYFADLTTGASAVTLDDGTTCSACDNTPHQCVTDGAGSYTYYHTLYAR
jgi:type II secretory pathway pseudopilin PulG